MTLRERRACPHLLSRLSCEHRVQAAPLADTNLGKSMGLKAQPHATSTHIESVHLTWENCDTAGTSTSFEVGIAAESAHSGSNSCAALVRAMVAGASSQAGTHGGHLACQGNDIPNCGSIQLAPQSNLTITPQACKRRRQPVHGRCGIPRPPERATLFLLFLKSASLGAASIGRIGHVASFRGACVRFRNQ